MEKINQTISNINGSVSYFIYDNDRGTPYTAITVLKSGDYYCTVYGSLCFNRSSHERLIGFAKPAGANITAEKFFNKN